MTKLKLLRAVAAGATGLTLAVSVGVVGASSNNNQHKDNNKGNSAVVKTENDLNVANTTTQGASSGSAEVEHNSKGGDAHSGPAKNDNTTHMSVTVDNQDCGSCVNVANGKKNSNSVKVTTENEMTVNNTTTQSAVTGNATIEHNKTAGNASTGSATNTNDTTIAVSVTNNK